MSMSPVEAAIEPLRASLRRRGDARLGSQRGTGLVEVLVALVIMGSAIIAGLSAFSTGSRAVSVTDEKVTARSLAQEQIELVRSYPFVSGSGTGVYPTLSDLPEGYSITVNVLPVSSTVLPGTKTTFLGSPFVGDPDSVQELSLIHI